jgi:hypothetical protein
MQRPIFVSVIANRDFTNDAKSDSRLVSMGIYRQLQKKQLLVRYAALLNEVNHDGRIHNKR